MKKALSLLLVVALMLGALACAPASAPEAEAPAAAPEAAAVAAPEVAPAPASEGEEEGIRLAFIACDLDDYMSAWVKLFESLIVDEPIDFIVYDGSNDAAKMLTDTESAITKGIDVILLQTVDPDANVACVLAANEAGIPILVKESDINCDTYDCLIDYGDQLSKGRCQAEWLIEYLAAHPEIEKVNVGYVLAHPSWGYYIYQGFNEIMEKNNWCDGKVKIIAEGNGNWVTDDTMALVEDWYVAYPEMNAIFCENDAMAIGAVNVLKSANEDFSKWIIGGGNGDDFAVDSIRAGELTMTSFRSSEIICKAVIDVVKAAYNGEPYEKQYKIGAEGTKAMDINNWEDIMAQFPGDFANYVK